MFERLAKIERNMWQGSGHIVEDGFVIGVLQK